MKNRKGATRKSSNWQLLQSGWVFALRGDDGELLAVSVDPQDAVEWERSKMGRVIDLISEVSE